MLNRRDVRRLIDYNKITGLVTTQCELTLQAKGHLRILIDDKTYRLADIVYILAKGKIPEHARVLQLNKNKLDFRLDNLYLDMTKANLIEKQKAEHDADNFFKSRKASDEFFK